MHEHLPALTARALDPLTHRLKLRLERVDPVVAHALDVEHLDPARALLEPQRALPRAPVRVPVREGQTYLPMGRPSRAWL